MSDFEWQPAYNFTVSKEPRVNRASFGDGYEQRVGDGLNNNQRSWQLVFTRTQSDIIAIDAFLTQKGAVDSFTWSIEGEEVRVVCKKWDRVRQAPMVGQISCMFEEVPI